MRVYALFIALVLLCLGSTERNTSPLLEPVVFSCGDCDHIIRGYLTDGMDGNIKPGDILCFDSKETYKRVKLKNIKGTAAEPIIIRNCGGVSIIPDGLRIAASQNFKLLGDGVRDEHYGIRVSIRKSFFITFEEFTTDFEVARVEVAGYSPLGLGDDAGFAGMGIKTSPYENCELFSDSTRQAWIMKNVSVHDNYIHDVGGEGLYIGHGFYKGRVEKNCSVKTWSHSIKGLRVYNNLVENTGFDGIQIKNADEDCEIYNNIIRNYGTRGHQAHNEGLMIADGVTGRVYNNLIHTGSGHGIMFQGMGNNSVFNNIIINAGQDGFNGTKSPTMGVYLPDGYYRIFNNTIINSGRNGLAFYSDEGGEKIIANNLVVKAGERLNPKGAPAIMLNNLFTDDSTMVRTLPANGKRFSMAPCLRAIDGGLDVRIYAPDLTFDFFDQPRPQGKGFDIGAVEFR